MIESNEIFDKLLAKYRARPSAQRDEPLSLKEQRDEAERELWFYSFFSKGVQAGIQILYEANKESLAKLAAEREQEAAEKRRKDNLVGTEIKIQ